ncbi:hypothetical protein NSTC745_06144 [Nostoc sp. DSM 114161]|jgi:hypothetical protein
MVVMLAAVSVVVALCYKASQNTRLLEIEATSSHKRTILLQITLRMYR